MTTCLPGWAEPDDGDAAWPLCPQALGIPARPAVDVALEPGETHITADQAELEEEGVSVLRGNVEISRDRQQLSADTITYDQPGATAELEGNIEYWDDAVYVRGESARVEFEQESGRFENSRYVVRGNRARGQADSIYHEYERKSKLTEVDYSTCDPEDNFWHLSAREITLDHENDWGEARHVVFRIKGVPVLYTPYASFPLSDKRKTGFLFPSFGNSNRNGFEVLTPFYWNIAPQMDATLTPRVLTDSGVMLMGQFRYLLPRGSGEFNGEYLPSDSEFDDDDRSFIGYTHSQGFSDTGNLFLTYNRVSDKAYFEDFGPSISLTSTRYLERRAEASYRGNWWKLTGRAQGYQTVDRSIPVSSRPYKRLPQVLFTANSPDRNRWFNYGLRSEISNFERDREEAFPTGDPNGLRFDLFPSISFPIHTVSTFFIPKAGLRYTQYSLQDEGALDQSSPSRILPVVSVDSGVFFERDTALFGTPFIQTLEPRLFYLYIPEENQDDLPVFDTGLYDFSFDSLFREDRFNGPDRMGDANQFTLAVTSRLINHASGREAGHVSLGQIYYLRDREVILPTGREREEDSSPIVAGVGISLIDHWRFRGDLQWDPNNNRTEKLVTFLQFNPAPDKVVNLGYRVRRTTNSLDASTNEVTDIEQSEISFHWPLGRQWSVVGRWDYALPEDRTVNAFAGLEYESCCWGFRVVGRRYITDVNGDSNTGIFLQLELKGLAGIGGKTVEFLEENIPGYQRGF